MKSFGVKHLIFDENNYTGHDMNSKEMNILYNYQERLYNKYSVSSFFLFTNIYILALKTLFQLTLKLCLII